MSLIEALESRRLLSSDTSATLIFNDAANGQMVVMENVDLDHAGNGNITIAPPIGPEQVPPNSEAAQTVLHILNALESGGALPSGPASATLASANLVPGTVSTVYLTSDDFESTIVTLEFLENDATHVDTILIAADKTDENLDGTFGGVINFAPGDATGHLDTIKDLTRGRQRGAIDGVIIPKNQVPKSAKPPYYWGVAPNDISLRFSPRTSNIEIPGGTIVKFEPVDPNNPNGDWRVTGFIPQNGKNVKFNDYVMM